MNFFFFFFFIRSNHSFSDSRKKPVSRGQDKLQCLGKIHRPWLLLHQNWSFSEHKNSTICSASKSILRKILVLGILAVVFQYWSGWLNIKWTMAIQNWLFSKKSIFFYWCLYKFSALNSRFWMSYANWQGHSKQKEFVIEMSFFFLSAWRAKQGLSCYYLKLSLLGK